MTHNRNVTEPWLHAEDRSWRQKVPHRLPPSPPAPAIRSRGQSVDITNRPAEDGSYRAHWLMWDDTLIAAPFALTLRLRRIGPGFGQAAHRASGRCMLGGSLIDAAGGGAQHEPGISPTGRAVGHSNRPSKRWRAFACTRHGACRRFTHAR